MDSTSLPRNAKVRIKPVTGTVSSVHMHGAVIYRPDGKKFYYRYEDIEITELPKREFEHGHYYYSPASGSLRIYDGGTDSFLPVNDSVNETGLLDRRLPRKNINRRLLDNFQEFAPVE